jgi:hypothetical protein
MDRETLSMALKALDLVDKILGKLSPEKQEKLVNVLADWAIKRLGAPS